MTSSALCRPLVHTAVLLGLGLAQAAHGQALTGTTTTGVYYEVHGAGEPVVFIHAFSVDRRMWAPQMTAFQGRAQVILFDLRGHGNSVAPTEPYTGYGDLLGILDTLGIARATLVGLSAGAELAINFAIVHPDRTARLVLAGPGLGGFRVPPLPWLQPVFQAAGEGDAERAAHLWAETPIMTARGDRMAAATLRRLVLSNSRLWTYRRTEQPLAPPAIERLAEIQCPALVIVGEEDLPHIKEIGDLLAREIAEARLLTVPGAGHFVNLDVPDAFNLAVRAFLRRP